MSLYQSVSIWRSLHVSPFQTAIELLEKLFLGEDILIYLFRLNSLLILSHQVHTQVSGIN